MIERRPAPFMDSGCPDVWWCTDCKEIIDYVDPDFKYKPHECLNWQCRELREAKKNPKTFRMVGRNAVMISDKD